MPFLFFASQKVQSDPSRRLAFCERITSTISCIYSSTRPANYCNTMDIGNCPFRKKRRPWRVDFSSLALVTMALAVCQAAVARAGKTVCPVNGCDDVCFYRNRGEKCQSQAVFFSKNFLNHRCLLEFSRRKKSVIAHFPT